VSGRDAILRRVREALGGTAPPAEIPRGYRTAGARDPAARVRRFCDRVGEYQAEVRTATAEAVRTELANVCATLEVRRLVIPDGLPADRRPDGVELVVDDGLGPAELDAIDGVVTGCTVAIAETGTIVLTAAPDEGRRAITLVPDLHICVVEEQRIVELLPEAIAVLEAAGAIRRPLTFVSGPSATSDIELSRVEGVHGPRTLVVLVVSGNAHR
jgi:L-lactate dehydrogenase complex protein LldG